MNLAEIDAELNELYAADTDKGFSPPQGEPMFDRPLLGVAAADDPWFARFKELLGEFHWTPQEALALAAPGAAARSVIVWSLPISATARRANRRQTERPAPEWADVRQRGEEFNDRLRAGLVVRLQARDQAAVAPLLRPEHQVAVRPQVGLAANWSERHVAFVAGLGTFSLSGGLITRRGVAHRLGSVVTDLSLPATARPYGEDAFAWCLATARGTCGLCRRRCPADSIGPTVAERNKENCRRYYQETIIAAGPEHYGWSGVYGCGLCQTDVPCEERNPVEPAGR